LTLCARVEYGIVMRSASRARWRLGMVASVAVAAAIAACTGDDETFRPAPTYAYDAASLDHAAPPAPPSDAAPIPLSCGDAGDAPPRLLVVNRDAPELAAFNLETRTVDGRYFFADGGAGVVSTVANSDPWIIDEAHELVTRLDAREPWKPLGTWSIHDDDGDGSSDLAVVVQVSCTKAYVVRRSRDRIAIIDPSQADGGTAVGFVDLSPFRAPGAALDLAMAVFVPAKKKVFVLAGNLDRTATSGCPQLEPSIFAIDVATDAVVSLAGKGAAGSIELAGYDAFELRYDAPFDRLLAVSRGCVESPGQVRRRLIEQVDLATGAVKTLLTLESKEAPTGLALLDGVHAIVTFASSAFHWSSHEPTLGPAVEGGLDVAALDGRGGLAGARRRSLDGGRALDLVSVSTDPDGGVAVLTTNPFSTPGGRAASLEPWPHR
jgi:hypothetical protein